MKGKLTPFWDKRKVKAEFKVPILLQVIDIRLPTGSAKIT